MVSAECHHTWRGWAGRPCLISLSLRDTSRPISNGHLLLLRFLEGYWFTIFCLHPRNISWWNGGIRIQTNGRTDQLNIFSGDYFYLTTCQALIEGTCVHKSLNYSLSYQPHPLKRVIKSPLQLHRVFGSTLLQCKEETQNYIYYFHSPYCHFIHFFLLIPFYFFNCLFSTALNISLKFLRQTFILIHFIIPK